MYKVVDLNSKNKPKIIEISLNYSCIELAESNQYDQDIAASSDSTKTFTKEFIIQKFNTFSMNVSNYISDRDFIIEDEHSSNRNGSLSHYITFYPTDEEGNIRDRFLIFLRLSDHNIKNLSSKSRYYHKTTAEKFHRSSNKKQKYIFENVVVDGKSFEGIPSALDYISDMLDSMEDGSYYK